MLRSRPVAPIFTTLRGGSAFDRKRGCTPKTADMNWLRVRIDLGELQANPVEQALLDAGAVAIEYSDAGDDPLYELVPGATPLWKTTQLSAIFEGTVSQTIIQLGIAESIAPPSMPTIEFDSIEDQDWVRRWRQDLQPMQFGSGLWVCAPGARSPDAQATAVEIEPGLGFGTGTHATTRLCLERLSRQNLEGKTILDYGCGSGILAIASLALGASEATAVDIDVNALTATRENAERNNCLERLQIVSAAALGPATRFDVIIANILSDTLIELQSGLHGHSRSGTDIILSGILTSQATDVIGAYRRWTTLKPAAQLEDWVILAGTVD